MHGALALALCVLVGSFCDSSTRQQAHAEKNPLAQTAVDVNSEQGVDAPWPTFRGGPQLRAYRKGRLTQKPRLLWRHDAKTAVESSAAIVDGHVYLGTDEHGLMVLDLNATEKKGKVLWTYKTEFGIRSSPGIKDGHAYFGDDAGFFYAVDLNSQKLAWKIETESGGEIISSASFVGDQVLFGSYDGNLYAFHRKDGKPAWTATTDGPVHCTPTFAGGRTFVAGCDEHLRAVSAADGKPVGALAMSAYSAGSPAVLGERLFVGTFGSQVVCVDWSKIPSAATVDASAPKSSESQSKKETAGTAKENKAAAGEDGKSETTAEESSVAVLWRYEHPTKKFPYYSSPAVGPLMKDGKLATWVVVIGGRDKMIHALDANNGDELWSVTTKARVDGSPVIVGDHVIVGGLDGNLYMLELATGDEFWRYEAGGSFRSSPAVGEGKLVISTDEGLIQCFDLGPAQ